MKNKHEGDFKGFIQLSRAYYGEVNLRLEDIKDEVNFGFYSPKGGSSGAMSMKWITLGQKVVPELEIFSDSWSALANMTDLIKFLGEHDGEDPTPDEFCQYLTQFGFEDLTEEKNPYEDNKENDPEYKEYLRLKEKFEN